MFKGSIVLLLVFISAPPSAAQGPSPESAAPIFPGGGLISFAPAIEMRSASTTSPTVVQPTVVRELPLTFAWGVRRDFQITVIAPIVTTRFNAEGGTGIGDATLSLKYRFWRADSDRGTTQASFSLGAKLATGKTDLTDSNGNPLPLHLQPGTGSTDLVANLSWTYTGLFNIRKLVADISNDVVVRTRGAQQTRQGNIENMRFWLSYRPYQQTKVGREWWIGPSLRWRQEGPDVRAGNAVAQTGEQMLLAGGATFFSPIPGLILWASGEAPVIQDMNEAPYREHSRITFGITRQFVIHR
jgi:hypothetical protein